MSRAYVGCVLGSAVIAFPALPASAGITFQSDADFAVFQGSGGFTKKFGGSVRWGNGTGAGDWEYAIVNASDVPVGAPAQAAWGDTNAHAVTFSYDGAGSSTLSLSGIGSITRAVSDGSTVLFARVRDSEAPFGLLSNIRIDLAYNGAGVDYMFDLLTGDANAEYWGIIDANLALGFTLTADAVLDGPRTAGSDPMYQFKVGVPAPSAAALLGLGGIIAARRRR